MRLLTNRPSVKGGAIGGCFHYYKNKNNKNILKKKKE